MRNVVVVSAARTPIGSFLGCFADFSAVSLGAAAGAAAIERAGISPSDIDEVIFGNVLSAGLGQNVARQISVKLGVPNEVPSFVVNQVCGSGLKAVALGSRAIACGDAEIILAGGTENMSQAPFVQKNIRGGHKMGNIELVDTLIADGLTDVFNNYHMGITAENLVEKFGISREEQDEYAANSQQKAQKAIAEGKFAAEIAPVSIPQRRGEPVVIDKDEYPRAGVSAESLAKLRPTFRPDGTVTAANSSGINDGAAVVVLMSEEKAKTLGLKPMATIISSAVSGVEPSIMGIGPAPATQKALQKAGFALSAIDLIEANEAFAAQAIAVSRELKLDPARINVNGGAIALGHPIGASGARILVTLLHEMARRDGMTYGLATLCIGGGMGISMIVKRV